MLDVLVLNYSFHPLSHSHQSMSRFDSRAVFINPPKSPSTRYWVDDNASNHDLTEIVRTTLHKHKQISGKALVTFYTFLKTLYETLRTSYTTSLPRELAIPSI